MTNIQDLIETSTARAIKSRALMQATCRRFQYLVRQNRKGEWEQVAIYCDPHGQPVAAKIRNTGKDGTEKAFYAEGDWSKVGFYGQHLAGSGGKKLTVTEGEIDCLSVSQAFDNRYPVVSVPKGAKEAEKTFRKQLEWLGTFEQIVICFDMDAPGREAAKACAAVLPPGKAFIAQLPEKDANELLKQGRAPELQRAIYNASPFRPDGVVDARELTERCLSPVVAGIPWPWQFLTEWTYGRRGGETYYWGAGTGSGKTDFAAEIIASTITGRTHYGATFVPEGFAVYSYEAGAAAIKKAIAGKIARRRFHIPAEADNPESWKQEDLTNVMREMDTSIWERGGKLFINENFGKADWEQIASSARFLARAEGITNFFIDPMSALVLQADDERQALDELSMNIAMLAQELPNAKFYVASHLTRPPEGKSHEEGGRVTLKQFRGSNGIVMFAWFVFGLERNQQAELPEDRTKTVVRSLKDRYTGNSLGKTQELNYDTNTGILDVAGNYLGGPDNEVPSL